MPDYTILDFLLGPGVSEVRSMGPGLCVYVTDLTDVTLDEDGTNSILTDDANRAN